MTLSLPLCAIYTINTNCDGAAGEDSGSEQQLSLEDFRKTPVGTVLVAAVLNRLYSTAANHSTVTLRWSACGVLAFKPLAFNPWVSQATFKSFRKNISFTLKFVYIILKTLLHFSFYPLS
jgi:hypothetical protein